MSEAICSYCECAFDRTHGSMRYCTPRCRGRAKQERHRSREPERGTCITRGCGKPAKAAGRCARCREWKRLHGSYPHARATMARDHRGPYTTAGCWEWTGTHDAQGYGHIDESTSTKLVHRMVFEAIYGWLPEVVMHRCDNPPCFNPAHLFPGDHAKNMADMAAKGRAKNRRPWFHWTTILAIRNDGRPASAWASELSISPNVVWAIRNERFYRTVNIEISELEELVAAAQRLEVVPA